MPSGGIIVRLLLTTPQPSRTDEAHEAEPEQSHQRFFVERTVRGLDLPTLFLGTDDGWLTPDDGLDTLTRRVLGGPGASTRCVGYVRNVVPAPDASYRYPTPFAHVPVFTTSEAATPVVDGTWLTVDGARAELSSRHWWPIVEPRLCPSP